MASPSSLSDGTRAASVDASAGATPNVMPARMASTIDAVITRTSGVRLLTISAGTSAKYDTTLVRPYDSSGPTPDATTDNITDSTSSWRTSRERSAPSALRKANSFRRDNPRDRSRLAQFAQATTSTSSGTMLKRPNTGAASRRFS